MFWLLLWQLVWTMFKFLINIIDIFQRACFGNLEAKKTLLLDLLNEIVRNDILLKVKSKKIYLYYFVFAK